MISVLFNPRTEESVLYEETVDFKRAFGPVMAVNEEQATQFLQHLGHLCIEPLDTDPGDLCQLYSEWYATMGLPEDVADDPTPAEPAPHGVRIDGNGVHRVATDADGEVIK